MIIKCPECSTAYNVPDEKIGDKPRKMRCSKCSTLFTVARRSQATPAGYEEFSGQHASLPAEFAFLREAPRPVEPQPPPPTTPEGLYRSVVQAAGQEAETIPLEPQPLSPPRRDMVRDHPPTPAPAAEPAPAAPTVSQAAAPAPMDTVSAPRPSAGLADIYGGSSSSWEYEAPLELESFTVVESSPRSQLAGKIISAIVALIVLFFVFVAYRNGWNLSLPKLPEQISFAFSGKTYERLPEEAEGIEVTYENQRLLSGKGQGTYVTVTGSVFNSNLTRRKGIVLRGRLIDSANDVRAEVRAPCGVVLDEDTIRNTGKGSMAGHYLRDGKLVDCSLGPEEAVVFQIVFDDVPVDYDSSFRVDIQVVAAQEAI